MKVIFIQDVPGTADAGEVRVVKNGFARNYLLPRGLAAPATTDQLQRLHTIQKAAEETRLKQTKDMSVVAEAMEGMVVTVEGRVGPTGRLYGAITSRHVAQELSKLTDRPADHRSIHLGDTLHAPGDYPVTVHLYRDVNAHIIVSVVPEGGAEGAALEAVLGETAPEEALGEAPAVEPEAAADEPTLEAPADEPEAAVDEAPEDTSDEPTLESAVEDPEEDADRS